MEEQPLLICDRCGQEFEQLNEYSLCTDCEEWVQDEKKSILETQESLIKL